MAARPAKLQRAQPSTLAAALVCVLGAALLALQAGEGRQDFQKEYAQRLRATAADDLTARYALARWLFEQGAYALALEHAQLLDIRLAQQAEAAPGLAAQVRDLRLQAQQRLKAPRAGPATAGEPATQPSARPLLTSQQINVIRVWESDPAQGPRVRIARPVLDQLLTKYGDSPLVPRGRAQREVRSWSGGRQLELLFALRAREFYDQVQVLDEPRPLRTFREVIHPQYVLKSCASVHCHASGRTTLTLHRTAPASDQTLYTNFYILHQAATSSGRVIDRARPEQSLLVQYGLPRAQSESPHPLVPGWRPALRGRQDPMYARLLRWIGRELYQPDPAYGIDPDPGPGLTPAPGPPETQPHEP